MAFSRRSLARRRPTLLRRVLFLAGLLMAGGLIFAGIVAARVLKNLPDPEYLFSRRVSQSTKIFDRTGGVLLYEIHGEEKRTIIPFSEMPAAVKNATIAIEDAKFYSHSGIDFRGIVRALLKDIVAGDFRQGGSTITQQLVKKSLLGDEKTIARKIKEVVLAVALEYRLNKDKILELYLNQIPYGQNAYGIEAAAQTYFGRRARELSVAESSLLAALPRAPSYYSPYGQHKDELLKRKDAVIERVLELGYISDDEAKSAKGATLKFLPAAKNIRAPHFVMFVRDYLNERYGEDEVERGGLAVYTTLDWKLQEEAEKIVRENAAKNEKLIKAKNMALVAVDPRSGDILAMVGSRDYFDTERDGNYNVATALRQPGSAFKPFVYATAFKKGFTPKTVLFDVATEFNPRCAPDGRPRPGENIDPEECYRPQDYDEKFRGPVTLRQALAQSLNVPSVKLLYLAGVEDAIRTAEDMGITTLGDRRRFGLSLVLGGGEVKLVEMTSAFSAFANDGVLNPPAAVLKVETNSGKILEEKSAAPRQVLDSAIARTINSILSDDEARVPVFAPHSSLYFPDRQVAVKTGTTQEYRDAWTVGYVPTLAVGVWAGNNDNTSIRQKGSGVMAAAPAWHAFMAYALARTPPEEFAPPDPAESVKPILNGVWRGNTVITIDTVSKKRATEFTPPETRQDLAYGDPHNILFWVDTDDPTGPPPQNPEESPQYANWESSFQEWLKQSGFAAEPLSSAPNDYDDVHTPEKKPKTTVAASLNADGSLTVSLKIDSYFQLKEAALISAEKTIDSRSFPPKETVFVISASKLSELNDPLEVRVYDTAGNISREVLTTWRGPL